MKKFIIITWNSKNPPYKDSAGGGNRRKIQTFSTDTLAERCLPVGPDLDGCWGCEDNNGREEIILIDLFPTYSHILDGKLRGLLYVQRLQLVKDVCLLFCQ